MSASLTNQAERPSAGVRGRADERGGEGGAPDSATMRIMHGALRGTIAAMAMTGMRAFTIDFGIVEEPPPQAIVRQRARGLIRRVHWIYGAAGGAAFGAIPGPVRLKPWAGPVYGLGLWLGFEAVLAPGLGLSQATRLRAHERVALAADHLLYGLVLAETRRRPQA